MPVVEIKMFKGRTCEQKKKIAEKVTEVLAEVAGTTPQDVSIHFIDMERSDFAEGGVMATEW